MSAYATKAEYLRSLVEDLKLAFKDCKLVSESDDKYAVVDHDIAAATKARDAIAQFIHDNTIVGAKHSGRVGSTTLPITDKDQYVFHFIDGMLTNRWFKRIQDDKLSVGLFGFIHYYVAIEEQLDAIIAVLKIHLDDKSQTADAYFKPIFDRMQLKNKQHHDTFKTHHFDVVKSIEEIFTGIYILYEYIVRN